MRIHQIDVTEGPLLVFGGPVSNLQATQAMRAEADRLGIPPGNCICTGDTVAYCANPAETVAEIRDWGCVVLAGNVERQLAQGAGNCGCGFDPGSTCDRLSAAWYSYADTQIDDDTRGWMATLPDALAFTLAGQTAIALHGGVTDISRFLWPTDPDSAFATEIATLPRTPDLIFAGHCGLPFQRRVDQTLWINAGSIGLPPNDGTPATRYALWHEGQATVHPLNYDHVAAARAMQDVGLIQGYHTALTNGRWPSQDVLPDDLRTSHLLWFENTSGGSGGAGAEPPAT